MPIYKADLHNHCDVDPVDCLNYSAREMIDRAKREGIDILAITPHGMVFDDPEAEEYARSIGMLLVSGIEKHVEGREVVILNPPRAEVAGSLSFFALTEIKESHHDDILVFAPHPFYPRQSCVGPLLDVFPELFDAVEYAHLYFPFYNTPNLRAIEWSERHLKPVLANSDAHSLDMIGRNYTEIEAPALDIRSLFEAIRKGRTRHVSRPHRAGEFLSFLFRAVIFQSAVRALGLRAFIARK